MLSQFILKDSRSTEPALTGLTEVSLQHVGFHTRLLEEDFLADNTWEPGSIHSLLLLLPLLCGLLLLILHLRGRLVSNNGSVSIEIVERIKESNLYLRLEVI